MESISKAFLVLCLVAVLCSCRDNDTRKIPLDKVVLQLKWVHQAQFAGFYVAFEKGYYADEHIRLSFLEGGNQVDITETLISGDAEFAVISPEDVLIKQSEQTGITAISVIYRRSAVVYLSHVGSGIIHPWDFIGKTVACKGRGGAVRDFELQFRALMEKLGLDISSVKSVPYDPEYTGFIGGSIDVTPAYITGGVVKLKNMGEKIHLIWPGDYGIHCYSDTLVTTKEFIDSHPDLVLRFLRASLKGWQDAMGDPENAVDAVMKYARIKDRNIQRDMMNAQLPLVNTGEGQLGWMNGEEWESMARMLESQNVIKKAIPGNGKVFTTRFLENVYGEKVH